MRFHCAISDAEDARQAVEQVIGQARAALNGKVDVAFVFFTTHDPSDVEEMVERLWLELDPQALLGCSAQGVMAGPRQIEDKPGVALLVAALPQVHVHAFHVGSEEWPALLADSRVLRQRLRTSDETRAIVGLGDQLTTPVLKLRAALAGAAPQAPLVVGLAGGGPTPGGNVLLRNDQVRRAGLVGLSLAGALGVESLQLPLDDPASAQRDLNQALAARQSAGSPLGALLFNGGGAAAHSSEPGGDVSAICQFLSDTPLAGFWVAGPLASGGDPAPGPGRNASLALFRP